MPSGTLALRACAPLVATLTLVVTGAADADTTPLNNETTTPDITIQSGAATGRRMLITLITPAIEWIR